MNLNFQNPFFLVLSITGIAIFVIALITKFFPPKEINALYGHRTKLAMASQENWDFAQKKWSQEFIVAGLVMIIFGLIGLLIPSVEVWMVWVAIILMILTVIFFSYRTEKSLKNFVENNSKIL